jgi:hypothetical protein
MRLYQLRGGKRQSRYLIKIKQDRDHRGDGGEDPSDQRGGYRLFHKFYVGISLGDRGRNAEYRLSYEKAQQGGFGNPGTELYEEHKQKYNLENWWQDRKGFTGEYRLKSRVVLFRHYLFDDQGQFEGGGFFNISKEIMNRIKSAAGFIGRFNLSRKQNRLSALCLFLTCKFSRILYFINHEAGYIFSGFILWVIGLKKHLGRKLLINGRKTL